MDDVEPEGGTVTRASALGMGAALESVADELARALVRFPRFNSPHEGWAVIREELDELWELVKANDGRGEKAHTEAIQVAAMACRYVHDLIYLDAGPKEDGDG